MRQAFARFSFYLLVFKLIAACGSDKNTPTHQASAPNFIPWSEDTVKSSTIINSRDELIKICLRGSVSEADFARAKIWSVRSILTWLRIAKSLDDRVKGQWQFTCTEPHITFSLISGYGTSMGGYRKISIYMGEGYGTWTHELGHAFVALGDTYYGGTAGYCQSGHPQSNMCWGAFGPRKDPEKFSTLWADDIEGFRYNYKVAFKDEFVPPTWTDPVDLEAPLMLENPWPGYVAPPNTKSEDFEVEILSGEGPTPILENISQAL